MARKRQNISVFVDSSVLFAATLSQTGGSAKLFTLKKLKLQTSRIVLTEVERNVREKLENYYLDRFFMLVAKMAILEQNPDDKLILESKKVIVDKDAIILAEGKISKANVIVTLDQKHFFTDSARNFVKPAKIMNPKELINS
ncbi:MAG: type II toxin-antitoxin system VapC family toxin [Patescibacteria group bacterium]